MVAYHTFSYSRYRALAFQHLGFLPPSFIVIAGFIVGQFYASRYDLSTWSPYGRLLIRGLKLLAIFTLLNLLLYVIQYREFGPIEGVLEFASRGIEIFFVGAGRIASFEVLVPIAYFLMFAPVVVYLARFAPWSPAGLAVASVGFCFYLEKNGTVLEHLNLFSAGLLGMALGGISLPRLNALASPLWLSMLFFLSRLLGESYLVQTFGACIALLFAYSLALRICSINWFSRPVVLLGSYSLYAYLAQIAVLHGLRSILGVPESAPALITLMLITLASTFLLVALAAALRVRYNCLDRAYKSIFA
jgi:hypothetical protein